MRLATVLDTPAERVWQAVLRPRLLDHVAWPIQVFDRIDPAGWPERWSVGDYQVRLRLFGIVPMGRQSIVIRDIQAGPTRYGLRDDGHGDLVKRWDHRITLEPISPTACRYNDEVEVRAGLLTPVAWAFVQIFYRHRQRRLRALVTADFATLREGAHA